MSAYHRDECKRIWEQLGCEEGGTISIADIVKHSRYLERCFPELLERGAKVAVRGAVAWETFEALYLGTPLPAAAEAGAGAEACEVASRPRSLEELRKVFDTLDVDMSGSISLCDVVGQQELVARQFPEMLAKWAEIDTDDSGTISWEEFRAFFGAVDDWLEFQLGEVVGLEDLKGQIRRFYRGVVLDEARRKKGHNVQGDGGKYHMIFQGNPGTGKTSMGRLMARLLYRVGLAVKDALREVQQEQLVAGYVGQTAPKTQKVIEEATGGVLFIDEAYRLSQGKDAFGKEAIEQLMSAMNSPPSKAPIMIFAGYPMEMAEFMKQNDGLYRRVPYTFDFPNYSCAELAEILELMVAQQGFAVEALLLANGRQRLARIIETKTLPQTRALMNGGLCERIFAFAKQALDARDDPEHPSVILTDQDIVAACQKIPPPPDPGGKTGREASQGSSAAELREMREHMGQLQAELDRLQQENAQLQREAAQGSEQDVMETTLKLPAADAAATRLDATSAMELRGIRELLKEVRRLKAELQGRGERVRELEDENRKLTEALRRASDERRGGHFPPGTRVQYLSGSINQWVSAVVQSYDVAAGTYDLDVKRGAHPDRVRALPSSEGERAARGRAGTSSETAERVAALFRRFDVNGDGCVDRAELAQVLRNLEPNAWPDARVDRLLAVVDVGRDGRIHYEEFIKWAFKVGAEGAGAGAARVRHRLTPEEKALERVLEGM